MHGNHQDPETPLGLGMALVQNLQTIQNTVAQSPARQKRKSAKDQLAPETDDKHRQEQL